MRNHGVEQTRDARDIADQVRQDVAVEIRSEANMVFAECVDIANLLDIAKSSKVGRFRHYIVAESAATI